MADSTGSWGQDHDDEPVLEIQVLGDVVPLDGVDVAGGITYAETYADGEQWYEEDNKPKPPVGRPVIASTLTGIGVAGTVVAAALPWSGGRNLPGIHSLTTGQSWLLWLLVAVATAAVLGVVALVRPGRRVRWWGAAAAVAGAALSGWAVVGLPVDAAVGVGPGLACVALVVLAAGQLASALSRAVERSWLWRPAGIAAAAVAVVLAGAGLGSAGLVQARDIDATTASAPIATVTGAPPSVVDTILWDKPARVYDVAGSTALVVGQRTRGDTTLAGVSALNLRTGAERWHHYERGWTVREATLTEDGSTALVMVDMTAETDVIGFDVATGTIRWRQRLAARVDCAAPKADEITPVGGCQGQFVIGDGILFLGPAAGDGSRAAGYVAADGRKWPIKLGPACRMRGAGADADGVYVLSQCVSTGFPEPHLVSETVIAYTTTGKPRWSKSLTLVKGTVAGGFGPVFVRADVVFAQQEQRYVALATRSGAQLWSTTDDFEPEDTVTDGTRLAWSTGVQVIMLDLHSGAQLWNRSWHFPEEADLPVMTADRMYLIQLTIGPNPYTCAEHATLLTVTSATGAVDQGTELPGGAGNDCGPDVRDHSFVRGPLLVLLTANTITVLSGR
ncbi:MAG TPA: PQQ-binding-like beta-propeller repeat protein [Pseudonocardiaceae bacterium]|nr:PQQ-binding-like beta-propeller repeat protein [Pseudonocardiaceae bacterium]